ncbi:DNA adenine methylase [Phaeocystidibacter marisrubri]|uniref:site-specific DNA-methyltransferase (adenine-specific) n=1 Tax=Phaeocystidibacter marisrubri TaxID=1577780 RepID=A0A6L3ZFL6_9FLAO|nr:DNA adenine methylase [Phaeocystidibacter marisrubri]KAB2816826.1 DNA adenine methylase [Phaeocystidibacter marisrubri]GGH77985.1 DNA methyltransferase [Phaeocystidibacter marisrubri]
MNFPSPLRYPGGKYCIRAFVSSLIDENDLTGISYAEPFAGGAGLALSLLYDEKVQSIMLNDFDPAIYSFWRTSLLDTTRLLDWIENVDINIDNWQHFKEISRNPENHSYLDLAKSTFFLNRTNVSGVLKGGPIGGLKQDGKYKMDARFNKASLQKRIEKLASYRDRIELSNLDGEDFLSKLNEYRHSVLIYIDPPYFVKGSQLYLNAFKAQDHQRIARKTHRLTKFWFTSYDFNESIVDLYSSYNIVHYRLSQNTSNRIGDEVIIFDPRLKFDRSVKNLKAARLLAKQSHVNFHV